MANERKNTAKNPDAVRLSPAPWLATAAGIVILALGVVMTFAVGVYSAGWHGPVSAFATRVLPFPAAIVRGHPLWAHEVLVETDAFVAYREAHPELQGVALTREQIQSNVLARLVQTALIEQLAAERGIVVTDAAVDAEFAAAKQSGAASQLDDMLKQFGWSEEDFKKKVIRVYLLQDRLRGTLGAQALDAALADQSDVVYLMEK